MKIKNKLGFTLLELLVVVLIIGILAAVALPQYQLAVDKAEFEKYQSIVASIRNAYYEYLNLHDTGPESFEELSFDMPSDFTGSYSNTYYKCVFNDSMYCCMSKSGESSTGGINCGGKDLSFNYSETLLGLNNVMGNRSMKCRALPNNARGNRLCKSIAPYSRQGNAFVLNGIVVMNVYEMN